MVYFKCLVFIFILMCSGCGGGGGGSDAGGDDVVDIPEITSRLVNPIRENGSPMGLSTFALGVQGKFPIEDIEQSNGATKDGIGFKTVMRSIRRIATNELFTFPEEANSQQIVDTLQYFLDNGHEVLHQIHVLNGPGMRSSSDPFVNGVMGYKVSAKDFVDLVQWNPTMRAAVLDVFSKVVVHAQALEAIGVDVYICPELEDNHSAGSGGSFGALMDLLKAAGWTNSDGSLRRDKVVRNGGTVGRISGIRYEIHPHSVEELTSRNLRPGDFVNTDGRSMYFDKSSRKPSYLFSEDEMRYMMDYAQEKQLIFFVWLADLQGLNQTGQWAYTAYPEYKDRFYFLRYPQVLISMFLGITEEEVELLPVGDEISTGYYRSVRLGSSLTFMEFLSKSFRLFLTYFTGVRVEK